jgi:hypothetical protein
MWTCISGSREINPVLDSRMQNSLITIIVQLSSSKRGLQNTSMSHTMMIFISYLQANVAGACAGDTAFEMGWSLP